MILLLIPSVLYLQFFLGTIWLFFHLNCQLQEMVLLVCFTCRYGGECVHFTFFSWQIQGYCSLSYSLKRKTCHMYHTLKSCILKHAPFHRSHSPRFLLCKINTLIFSPALLNKSIFLTLLK